jgi:MerR family transcriptional regulator, copper efflux regulator
MRVSELATRAGVSAKAIRFYEAEGILPAAPRAPNGYREYGEVDLCRVRVLAALRSLGIDLREAGRLAGLCSAGRCDEMAGDLARRIAERRAEVIAARAELDHLEGELAGLERALAAGRPHSTLCLERRSDDDPALRLPVRM